MLGNSFAILQTHGFNLVFFLDTCSCVLLPSVRDGSNAIYATGLISLYMFFSVVIHSAKREPIHREDHVIFFIWIDVLLVFNVSYGIIDPRTPDEGSNRKNKIFIKGKIIFVSFPHKGSKWPLGKNVPECCFPWLFHRPGFDTLSILAYEIRIWNFFSFYFLSLHNFNKKNVALVNTISFLGPFPKRITHLYRVLSTSQKKKIFFLAQLSSDTYADRI